MGSEHTVTNKTHVLALPLPFQGHINPMLQFSKRLASKGVKVTLLTFTHLNDLTVGHNSSVNIEFISKEDDEDDYNNDEDDDYDIIDYFKNLRAILSLRLPEIVARHSQSGFPISCLIYDSLMHWALAIAKNNGILGASLFTQCCGVSTVYFEVHERKLNVPIEKVPVLVEGLPLLLEMFDLPSFVFDLENYPGALTLLSNQFLNLGKADWVFFNTFNTLEDEMLNWMASKWSIKPIGPTIPSMYLDKRIEDNKDYGLSLFKPNIEGCMKWLDSRESRSVVYVSYGSLSIKGEKQMLEIASGLKRSNNYFLWVVRESEKEKLPTNFVEETIEKGLVVSWCPQLEVLAHRSVGCFLTHCGWNSTLEALSLGVPMVAMPEWTDQTTNAKFVADLWKVGVRVKVNEEGIVKKEEIEMCIREVMEGDKASEIRKNCEKWKKLAKEAMGEGGSSDKNIEEFITKLMCIF